MMTIIIVLNVVIVCKCYNVCDSVNILHESYYKVALRKSVKVVKVKTLGLGVLRTTFNCLIK